MMMPATRYRDCEAALTFLKAAFGLEEHAVFRDDRGEIIHAQMVAGRGMMMFGPRQGGDFDRYLIDPSETGGRETTTIYVVTSDVADRFERAKANGARILLPLTAQDHGGQSFSVADPEGHVWTFGDYNPLA